MVQLSQLAQRPDNGGQQGRSVTVKANMFPVKILADVAPVIFQYSVSITPTNNNAFPARENTTDKRHKIPTDITLAAFRQVELVLKETLCNPKACFIFNGEAIAYSNVSMKEDFEVDIIAEKPDPSLGYNDGGRDGRDAPPRRLEPAVILTEMTARRGGFERLKFSLKYVKDLSLAGLMSVALGNAAEDASTLETSNMLSVLLRYVPSLLYVPHKNEFFSPVNRRQISGGLEIWRGYHQSVRAIQARHLGVNVDIASAIFRSGGMSVLNYLQEVANLRPNDIGNMRPRELLKLLKNVMVVTNHRGEMRQRFKINGISDSNAANEFFELEGNKTSIADYFAEHYNRPLNHPNLPLVVKGSKGTKFPLECLDIVPSQRVAGRLNGNQTAEMIKATCQKPFERLKQIEDGLKNTLHYNNNEYLESFGIKVEPRMMEVSARILPAPQVVFNNGNREPGQSGVWNLRNKKVVDAPLLKSCAFVFFAKTSRDEAENTRSEIIGKWGDSGMNIDREVKNCPILITNPGIISNIRGGIQRAFRDATTMFGTRCQLIVCVLEKEFQRGQYYKEIKRVCLCEAGVASQVMLSNNVLPARNIKPQYIANVALKANIKLGGASNHVDRNLTAKSAMFLGIDVSHPPPGTRGLPSICAMVASTDSNCTKFNTYVRPQSRRVEIIVHMGELVKKAISDYKLANSGMAPAQVYVFRDGVSQSQFLSVKSEEIQSISDALKEMGCKAELVVLVVQKRHHLRLFPGRDVDRSGNCLPGTCIDTQITHPYEFNFVLQSHAGIQGMSRPTIYYVLHNEAQIGSDELQKLCFDLCYLSERATRSISVVSPSYRASLAATYARMFIEGAGDDGFSDTISMISDSTNATMTNFAEGVENQMYYM